MTMKNGICLMRLFLLFALYVTVPMVSCSYVPNYGLFGELKPLVVVSENKEEIFEISARIYAQRKQKGKNIFNLWLYFWAFITCLRLLAHTMKSPKAGTIVAQKVRMNN